ncbi:adenylyl-sulfate kinase [Roseateles sp. BYS78W]|uniref:Adenylyl-sulfate kinase n=1 Tax=Pelomonas candidula TaxID=3299025 RepID=A0ABW7HJ25_9BURK
MPHTFWFTGLPGAGKTTLAKALQERMFQQGRMAIRLDGDDLRLGPHKGLGFSDADRQEHLRRTASLARLLNDQGFHVLVSLISPTEEVRQLAREIVSAERYFEIFVKASLEVCIARDPKGLYEKARAGVLQGFTGISASYGEPRLPSLTICTENSSIEECLAPLLGLLDGRETP